MYQNVAQVSSRYNLYLQLYSVQPMAWFSRSYRISLFESTKSASIKISPRLLEGNETSDSERIDFKFLKMEHPTKETYNVIERIQINFSSVSLQQLTNSKFQTVLEELEREFGRKSSKRGSRALPLVYPEC